LSDITVFDVETPNMRNDCICSIGFTYIQNGLIIGTDHILINPDTNFDPINISIHGITPSMVADAPFFPEVWEQYKHLFESSLIIAHNANFDLCVLDKTLNRYDIKANPIFFACTLELSKTFVPIVKNYKLSTLCDKFGIEIVQCHNAANDSLCCAELLLTLVEEYNILLDDYIKNYTFNNIKQKVPATGVNKVNNSENTQSLQLLQGILLGITCDNFLTEEEIYALKLWIDNNAHLAGQFPYDKVFQLIQDVLEDGILEQAELDYLLKIFKQITDPVNLMCETQDEEIKIKNKNICLTGEFLIMTRHEFEDMLCRLGAICQKSVTKTTDFLIVGDCGSEQWSCGNYGLKVKKAMELQQKKHLIKIIREKDFLTLLGGCYE